MILVPFTEKDQKVLLFRLDRWKEQKIIEDHQRYLAETPDRLIVSALQTGVFHFAEVFRQTEIPCRILTASGIRLNQPGRWLYRRMISLGQAWTWSIAEKHTEFIRLGRKGSVHDDPPGQLCTLTVATKGRPDVLYPFDWEDRRFYKMPSCLRRSTVNEALGKVSSYRSSLANWEAPTISPTLLSHFNYSVLQSNNPEVVIISSNTCFISCTL